MSVPQCTECRQTSKSCTFDRPLGKPGLKKGLVQILEGRVQELETELQVTRSLQRDHSPMQISNIITQSRTSEGFVPDQMLVNHFFKYAHFVPFFHQASFLKSRSDGSQNQALVYAMYAIGLRYHKVALASRSRSTPNFRLADDYYEHARALGLQSMDQVTLVSLQVLFLLSMYSDRMFVG